MAKILKFGDDARRALEAGVVGPGRDGGVTGLPQVCRPVVAGAGVVVVTGAGRGEQREREEGGEESPESSLHEHLPRVGLADESRAAGGTSAGGRGM